MLLNTRAYFSLMAHEPDHKGILPPFSRSSTLTLEALLITVMHHLTSNFLIRSDALSVAELACTSAQLSGGDRSNCLHSAARRSQSFCAPKIGLFRHFTTSYIVKLGHRNIEFGHIDCEHSGGNCCSGSIRSPATVRLATRHYSQHYCIDPCRGH
jgi:hypothetical protein